MNKTSRIFAAALLASSALAPMTPARAADNYSATQGGSAIGTPKDFRCIDVASAGICYPAWVPYDATGTALLTSTNAGYVRSIDGAIATLGSVNDAGCVGDSTPGCTIEARLIRLTQVTTSGTIVTGSPGAPLPSPTPQVVTVQGFIAPGVTCGAAVDNCVLKASPGSLLGVYANCTAACWLMVFNSTTAPSNGATTSGTASGNMVECIDVAAGSSKSITYPLYYSAYTVGITAVISSSACGTLTKSAVGFVRGTAI